LSAEEVHDDLDALFESCLHNLNQAILHADPQNRARARELKGEILQLQIRLDQRRKKGIGFEAREAEILQHVIPRLRDSLPIK
jgi:hypothetical protein